MLKSYPYFAHKRLKIFGHRIWRSKLQNFSTLKPNRSAINTLCGVCLRDRIVIVTNKKQTNIHILCLQQLCFKLFRNEYKQVPKVIWQKATSPYYHPSRRWQTNSSVFDQSNTFLGSTWVSPLNGQEALTASSCQLMIPYCKIFEILFRKFTWRHRLMLLCSNVVKFVRQEIGETVRYLPYKKHFSAPSQTVATGRIARCSQNI